MAWRGLEILGLLAGGPQFTREVAAALGVPAEAACGLCRTLRARGLIRSAAGLHEITAAGRAALAGGAEVVSGPPKGGCAERYRHSLRAKVWRVLRIRGKAGLDDLLPMILPPAATPRDEANARRNIARYLRALTRSGHLVALPRRGGPARWLLARNTGPCAPAVNNVEHAVSDPNTGEVRHV